MYVQEPQLEGLFDNVKAALSKLKKIQPGKIILREAGYDPNANPKLDIVTTQPQQSSLLSSPMLIVAAIAVLILAKKR
jgi:hypothetical protein